MKPETLLKSLIWLYVTLLLFEGSLRKWVLPGLSDALLVVRDPVVILIYALALAQGRLPFNGWVLTTCLLAGASAAGSMLAGQDNLLITLYGLRTNYLHLPLIWVFAAVLTRRDVENLGKALLLFAIPLTLIMVLQFYSPPVSWINKGVGTDEETMGQLYGALGHIRPPGFFAFITGPQLFYPLAMAFLCHEVIAQRRLWIPLLAACGMAILLALPISISRTVAIATGFVAVLFLPCLMLTRRMGAGLLRIIIIGALVLGAASFLPVFDEARTAFLSRWETAAGPTGEGVDVTGIFDRLFGGWDYLGWVASSTSLFGSGVGMGSNVAARLSTGRLGFTLAENEWAKCLLELGLPLALAFLAFRFALAFALFKRSIARLFRSHDPLPLLILSACGSAIVFGQWAPPTILGFAILGAGLCLAACQDEPREDEEGEAEDDAAEAADDGGETETPEEGETRTP